jgi:uncharacterized peroxidase-related enzyme
MSFLRIHTKQSAPNASQPLLASIESKYGMIPNLLAEMAEAPNVLKAYLDMASQVAAGTLTPVEVQVVQIAASRLNGCQYCVAAHSAMSEKLLPPPLLNALKAGAPISDNKLSALRTFVIAVVGQHGWVRQADLQAFLEAGYTRSQICEVVLAVAQKVLSNYLNHVADTPIDQVFQAHVVTDLKKAM